MKDLVDFGILIIIYFWKFFKKWKEKGNDVLLLNTTMYIYLSFLLYFTLMPIITSLPFIFNHPYEPMNLIPFIDCFNGRGDFIRQILLNILMTIPFGFLISIIKRKNINLSKVLFYTFLLSLSIEILQPLISGIRSSDITDVITNTIGGFLGYILYLIFKPIINKILDFLNNKKSYEKA